MNDRTPQKTILILAANPTDTARLRLDLEGREICDSLLRSQHRDQFISKKHSAIRVRDIRRALLDDKPGIVHFCGHGHGENGLAVEDENGETHLFSTQALANLFRSFQNKVECVVLNACYSEVQALAISEYIPYVVGMSQDIGDETAVEFAVGFYDALGAGLSYEEAYNLGCNAIEVRKISSALIPRLYAHRRLWVYPSLPRISSPPPSPPPRTASPPSGNSPRRSSPSTKRKPSRSSHSDRQSHADRHRLSASLLLPLVQKTWFFLLPTLLIWMGAGWHLESTLDDASMSDFVFRWFAIGGLAGGFSGCLGGWALQRATSSVQWDQFLLSCLAGVMAGSIGWLLTIKVIQAVSVGLRNGNGSALGFIVGTVVTALIFWRISFSQARA
ncbi:MAG: CHAT domain-containing protein [Oscillatoriophycideae cyanobacterium NC_groundwater_1537_Pr4_S-0.65um_50_18]|nr:CHAT domain-containing protein [Oscillatoriophycideae cyanobacterium NC_groundwater_1537_Pr4_S-0.65um_50_18]